MSKTIEFIFDFGSPNAYLSYCENNCVLGVTDQSCILINIERNPEDKGINAIQDSSRALGESLIDEINQVFDTNAEFFQVYIHTNAETNNLLGQLTSTAKFDGTLQCSGIEVEAGAHVTAKFNKSKKSKAKT